ncbi:glutamate--tRNA ligase family protein [Deminuibacter soli]|uniref:tRNA glutamyl-Q synthetase n=1 Tax=Deminuibacter soli TaxID=2291815 RepID=A0A3E1NHH3_9BACT|nr:glutamate--tRNA ligase family protein [Deminuibacter soli]RFM27357.1 tRNA glutamyl-Q synthetase [Deminuibacter soli]
MYPSHFHKTRIAPTPSGYLHVGNVLSFALTAALARTTGATVLLRIDDLDRDRIQPAYVQDIFNTLQLMEIPWDEGAKDYGNYLHRYSQVHRLPLYQQALQQLRDGGHVFACDCSRAQILRERPDGVYPGTCIHKNIPLDTPGVSWRLHTSETAPIRVNTFNKGIVTATLPALMQSFVVRKKDGYPAYQLASVADDDHFGVDLVVRGEDLWSSTLAQHYLATLLPGSNFGNTVSYHHPLLLETADRKLSKSAGATSVQHLHKSGKTAADIYTMIAQALGYDRVVRDYTGLGELMLG